MKKTAVSYIKKYWIATWIAIAVLVLLVSVVAHAAYTKTDSAKIVVARYGEVGNLFSSNYLQPGAVSNSYIYLDPLGENDTAEDSGDFVRISNFAQGNQAIFYDRAINYNLTLKLLYNNNGTYSTISAENASSIIGTQWIKASIGGTEYIFGYDTESGTYKNLSELPLTSSLAGRQASTDVIELLFSANQVSELSAPTGLTKLYLEITATPNPSSTYKDLETLSTRMTLALSGSVNSVVWEGYYNDEAVARNAKANDATQTLIALPLEGYNYVIEGIGASTITLKWNTQYLNLNEGFILDTLNLSVPTPVSDENADDYGWATLSFPADSGRYDLQFYRSGNKSDSDYNTWNQLLSYIDFSYSS